MKKHNTFYLIIVLMSLLITGCSDSESQSEGKAPSEKHLKDEAVRVFSQRDSFFNLFELKDFTVITLQNTGTEVEPLYKSRVKLDLTLREDMYERDGSVAGQRVYKKTFDRGHKLTLVMIGTTTMPVTTWKTTYSNPQSENDVRGIPYSNIKDKLAAGAMIKDSKDYKDLVKQEEAVKVERWKKLIELVNSKKTYEGEAGEPGDQWPYKLTFKEFNPFNYTFTAELEWTTLNALHRVEGTLNIDSGMTFREVGFIKRGEAAIHNTYYLTTLDDGKLKGRWNRGRQNWVWLKY